MAGLLLPPINLDFLDQLGADLAAGWRQNRHPVYNAAGVQVGSYDTLDALCQGAWFPLVGVTRPPPSQLYVVNFWGRRVPLSTQCVAAAKATAGAGQVAKIVQPQPVQPASAAVAVQAANAAATGSPAPIDLDAISGPLPGVNLSHADLVKYGTYALWAGGAVLAGALIFGGDGRSPRRR